MKWLKRWAPLVGTGVLAGSVILKALGMGEVAAILEGAGSVTGVTQQSPVGAPELGLAIAAITGVVLKVTAVVKSKLSEKPTVR